MFNAAYDNWVEGIDLLVSLGAKVDASNNAGDTPYRWAENMQNEEAMEALKARCGSGVRGADYRARTHSKDTRFLRDGKRQDASETERVFGV